MKLTIAVLPGDGVGAEVTREGVRVLEIVAQRFGHEFTFVEKSIGAAAYRAHGVVLPDDTLRACLESDAVLLGAVGSPELDHLPPAERPEAALLRLRRELGGFANLRPAFCHEALTDYTPLKPEVVRGADVLIVRELLGGLYFGEPRGMVWSAEATPPLSDARHSKAEALPPHSMPGGRRSMRGNTASRSGTSAANMRSSHSSSAKSSRA